MAYAARAGPEQPPGAQVLQGPGDGAGGYAALDESDFQDVAGFGALVQETQIPAAAARGLIRELKALGALSVHEVLREDWEAMPTWAALRPMEKRRILARCNLSSQ